jgi:hypothetical protein
VITSGTGLFYRKEANQLKDLFKKQKKKNRTDYDTIN